MAPASPPSCWFSYLAWYWYPAALGGVTAGPGGGSLIGFSATVSTWLQGNTTLVVALAVVAVLAVAAVALRHRLRTRTTARNAVTDCCASSAGEPVGSE